MTEAVAHISRVASGPPLDPTLRVTCSFHPDRRARRGTDESVIERLVRERAYTSQFVTGTSNGGLTAVPGGDRFRWESAMFAGAYDGADPDLRPKYGALNHRRRTRGASPRFGSSYIRLARHTLSRTTFCYPDSSADPADFGTADACGLVRLADADQRDLLNDYVEAQVHGHVDLAVDVEAVVLDPSYRGTPVERAAARLPCPLEWHEGFVASVGEIAAHPQFRGREIAALAARLARDGTLNAQQVGVAANTGEHHPQTIKQVWHCVARFG